MRAFRSQFSGLEPYRALHERIVRMAGELPQADVYTQKTLREVIDGRAVILMDSTGSRIQIAPVCAQIGGVFYVSRETLETADFRWYVNRRLDHRLVKAMDVR